MRPHGHESISVFVIDKFLKIKWNSYKKPFALYHITNDAVWCHLQKKIGIFSKSLNLLSDVNDEVIFIEKGSIIDDEQKEMENEINKPQTRIYVVANY